MKILQVCPKYYPSIGGVEEHVRNISERLVQKHEVTIATTDPAGYLPKEEVLNRVRVLRFKSWAPSESYFFSRKLQKYLQSSSGGFDFVHAHSYHALPAFYAARTKSRNKLVFTPHYLGKGQTSFRNLLHFPYKFASTKIFSESDRVICVSNFERKTLEDRFGLKEKKLTLIPNGVDKDELSKYSWSPSLLKMTFAGRLEEGQKNVDKIIQALEMLVQKYSEIRLVLIGHGPAESGLKRLAEKLGVEGNIRWKGWLPREEYLEEISSSNVFLMPSQHECYGIAAAEAITLGVPTLVADSGALSEFVENGLAFGIDMPITPQKIADAVDRFLSGKQTPNRLSPNDKIISWDEVTRRLERLFMEVLGDVGS